MYGKEKKGARRKKGKDRNRIKKEECPKMNIENTGQRSKTRV